MIGGFLMINRFKNIVFCITSFFISSFSVVLMPLFNRDNYLLIANILAAIFWGFLVIGIIFTMLLLKTKKKKRNTKRIFGLFKTKTTKITDSIMILSLLIVILLTLLEKQNYQLQMIFLFLFLYSTELHFVFTLSDN